MRVIYATRKTGLFRSGFLFFYLFIYYHFYDYVDSAAKYKVLRVERRVCVRLFLLPTIWPADLDQEYTTTVRGCCERPKSAERISPRFRSLENAQKTYTHTTIVTIDDLKPINRTCSMLMAVT